MLKSQKGFTLIELVMIIVILGILAAVAVPRYVDMQTSAAVAQANGVYGGAQAAAAINFSKGRVGASGHTAVTTAQTLLDAMDGTPTGWAIASSSTTTIRSTVNSVNYDIGISSGETTTHKADLAKSW